MAHKNQNKTVKQEEIKEKENIEQKEVSSEKKEYFPNIQYNKSQRIKFFSLMIVFIACMGVAIGLFITINQGIFGIVFGALMLMVFFLIPSTLKSHPVKPGVPELVVEKKKLTIQGKEFEVQDIESVGATVLLPAVSKLDSENKEFIQEMAKTFPEEPCFGNLDIVLKKGPKTKKGEVLYLTIEDCVGAVVSLVSAGVKHYKIGFSLKKLNEPAQFSITKEETKKHTLLETSEKERKKQLL